MMMIQNNNLTGEKDSLDFLEARLDPTKNILHEGHLPSCALVQVTMFPLLDKITLIAAVTTWKPGLALVGWWLGDGGLANGQTGGNALKASLCAEASHIRQSGWQGTVLLEGLSTQPTFLPPS